MDMLAAKLISLSVLILLTLTFSVIPYFLVLRGSGSLVSARRREKVIAVFNCFGGGVFLGTLLLHLMTEGSEEFEMYKSKAGLKTEFPLFNLFIAGGFFLVAFIEFLMHSHLHHKKDPIVNVQPSSEDDLLLEHDHNHIRESQYGAVGRHRSIKDESANTFLTITAQKDGGAYAGDHEAELLLPGKQDRIKCEPVRADYIVVDSGSGAVVSNGLVQRNHDHQDGEIISADIATSSEPIAGIVDVIAERPDGLRAFLLLFALSFHTIFDGLAVGLQDSVSEVWQVFIAISIHKSIIAFCLGLELFKCHLNTPWRAFAWVLFFSFMSPIGIGLGIGLTSGGINEQARFLASSILQGVAAGTFLYVTFLEILNLYIGHNCHRKFIHIFSAMVGFVFMAGVKLLDHD